MDLPEYRAAIREAEAVQEQTAAATQELTDLQEQRTELKREIMSLSGASAALKAAEPGACGLRYHPTRKNAHRGCQGRYGGADQGTQGCGHDRRCGEAGKRGAEKGKCRSEKRQDRTQKKVPSIKDRMEAAAKQNQLERLQYENMELKEALEEERSFSDPVAGGHRPGAGYAGAASAEAASSPRR